jgi:threonine dehydrogenase-like Zn-dependent dehydrogenase
VEASDERREALEIAPRRDGDTHGVRAEEQTAVTQTNPAERRGGNDRRFAGGVSWGRAGNAVMARGADFVVEAAGLQAFPPKVEAQPDPTNVKTVQQAWDSTRMGGHVMLMGLTLQPVSFPGTALALLGRTIHPGQQGGLHAMRDIPRYVKLIENGKIDAKSMITKRYTLENSRQAVQDTADRTVVTGVIEFA